MEARIVRCGNCKTELPEKGGEEPADRQPCPQCGSSTRLVEQGLEDTLTVRSALELKARLPSGRPFMLQKVGDSFYRLTGRWHRLHRVIDRRHNHYYERIEDAETGEVVRLVDEPLTEHPGRGSARGKKK